MRAGTPVQVAEKRAVEALGGLTRVAERVSAGLAADVGRVHSLVLSAFAEASKERISLSQRYHRVREAVRNCNRALRERRNTSVRQRHAELKRVCEQLTFAVGAQIKQTDDFTWFRLTKPQYDEYAAMKSTINGLQAQLEALIPRKDTSDPRIDYPRTLQHQQEVSKRLGDTNMNLQAQLETASKNLSDAMGRADKLQLERTQFKLLYELIRERAGALLKRLTPLVLEPVLMARVSDLDEACRTTWIAPDGGGRIIAEGPFVTAKAPLPVGELVSDVTYRPEPMKVEPWRCPHNCPHSLDRHRCIHSGCNIGCHDPACHCTIRVP